MSHTKAKWRANKRATSDGVFPHTVKIYFGKLLVAETPYYKNCKGHNFANARRIVACVNWCAGNSTEGMERAVEIGRPYAVERDAAIERELELIKQRDELLSALKTIIKDNSQNPSLMVMIAEEAIASVKSPTNPEQISSALVDGAKGGAA